MIRDRVLLSLDLSGITTAIGEEQGFYTPTLKNGVLLRNTENDIFLYCYFCSVLFHSNSSDTSFGKGLRERIGKESVFGFSLVSYIFI